MSLSLLFKALALPNRQLLLALKATGSLDKLYEASRAQLLDFFKSDIVDLLCDIRETGQLPQNYDAVADAVDSLSLHLVVYGSDEYPVQLAETHEPPAIFFVQGPPGKLQQPQVAIVGSRKPTALGERTAHEFAQKLSSAGFGVTSGLAAGIDCAAHGGALSINGYTCAVLGTGSDIIYPRRNLRLAERILESGGNLVTEFLPGSPPKAAHFPQRNRIVTGLSLGVVVVEANERSGSLISARLGAEQGREVFAVPGSIYSPVASGCHRLIREGATLVTSPEQVVEQLGPMLGFQLGEQSEMREFSNSRDEYEWLLGKMGFDPIQVDDLCLLCARPCPEITAALTQLELSGRITQTALGYQRLA